MSTMDLELRVLMGLQAGARMGVSDGHYVLGAGEAADIVLSGPRIQEEHAALTIASGRATITPHAGVVRTADGAAITAETDLVAGQVVDCDGAWIAVAAASSPWPDVSDLLARRVAGASAGTAPAATGAEPVAASRPKPRSEGASAQQEKGRRRTLPAALVPIAVAFALVLLSGAWLLGSGTPVPSKQAQAAPRPDPAADATRGMESRIAAAGLAGRVSARKLGGAWTLVGIVDDESERDKLRLAFANVSPPVAMRVHTQEEVSAAVAAIIARSGMPVKFELASGGRAKLVLAAPNAETAEQIAQSFREELGGVRDIETEFVTPATLIPPLQELVNKAGLGGRVRLAPAGPMSPHIAAQGALANDELERWNLVLAEFARRHGDFVKVQGAITRLSPVMPFRVRAVLDGATPQVITADGDRILEGGTLRGYRLVAIRENELVFDGPEKVSIARPKSVEAPRAAAPR